MKFIVDQPLGGLAKWLRFCGFDAMIQRLSPGAPQKLPAPLPGAYLLTRQQGFKRFRREDLLVLTATDPEGQLQEVMQRLDITRRQLHLLSRCGQCNEVLEVIPRERAQGLVPEHVFHTQEQFHQCPRCGQVFWPGSHHQGIMARVLAKLSTE
ncbi:MAG: Mut7-C RNAse domain-containing protein [Thermodesulfobacteriota bacterium]